MKILVTGDRNWDDLVTVVEAFEKLLEEFDLHPQDITLIHGAATGADTIADIVGNELGMDVRPYPARWSKYGRAAGPIRNKEMLDENPDIKLALAFHSDLERSKGTRDMIIRLKRAGIEYRHYK